MSRTATDRLPISSWRSEKSGISSRFLTPRRTRSAAAERRRSGLAMVEASSIDSSAVTRAATPKTRRIALRSAATILSMSPPSVDSSSTPSTARKRWIGTATETICSPFSLTRTIVAGAAGQRLHHLGEGRAIAARLFAVDRQRPVAEQVEDEFLRPLDEGRLLLLDRRQVEAQDLAARIEMARIEQQVGVAVVDAGARAGRRDQPPQQRRDALRIDRKVEAVELVGAGPDAFAGLQLEQLVGVDADRIGLDGRRSGDGAGDDLALRQQALDAGVDQPVAELVEVEDAGDQHGQAGEVEEEDAPGQAGEEVVAEEAAQPAPSPGRQAKTSEPRGRLAAAAGLLISASIAMRLSPRRPYASRNR